MSEIWKDIPKYESLYQISDKGRVKSLDRQVYNGKGYYIWKELILKSFVTKNYLSVILTKDKTRKTISIHQLMVRAFLGHKSDGTMKLVVDHINNNKLDNHLKNLRIVTQRENSTKYASGESKYIGVHKNRSGKKWIAQITTNNKCNHLGTFDYEFEAFMEYEKAKRNIFIN